MKWLRRWNQLHQDIKLEEQFHFNPDGRRAPYRLDFCHLETKVCIEISGGVHSIHKQRIHDYEKLRHLVDKGWKVYQFDSTYDTAKCRIDDNIEQVVRKIKECEEIAN